MNWEELEQKHQEQWEKFEERKDAEWQKIQKDKAAMYAAFGDHEAKIPISVFERVERDRKEWQNAWGDNGYKARYLLAVQKKERDTLKTEVKSNILAQIKEAREKSKIRNRDRERDD